MVMNILRAAENGRKRSRPDNARHSEFTWPGKKNFYSKAKNKIINLISCNLALNVAMIRARGMKTKSNIFIMILLSIKNFAVYTRMMNNNPAITDELISIGPLRKEY